MNQMRLVILGASGMVGGYVLRVIYPEVVQGGDRPNAGVVDENVKLAVTLARQVDETRHVLALSHVSLCIGHLATRSRDPTSKALQAFQSARSEHDLGAAFSEHYRSNLAYSTARARNDDDLVFSSLHKILFQTLRSFPAEL